MAVAARNAFAALLSDGAVIAWGSAAAGGVTPNLSFRNVSDCPPRPTGANRARGAQAKVKAKAGAKTKTVKAIKRPAIASAKSAHVKRIRACQPQVVLRAKHI